MTNPLVLLARAVSEARSRSKTAAGMMPIAKVGKAVVLMDACCTDSAATLAAVQKFFAEHKTSVRIYALALDKMVAPSIKESESVILVSRKQLCWYGKMRKKVYSPDEDLFIDITPGNSYASVNAALRSTAAFKVARRQLRKDVFSVEITGSEGKDQKAVFDTVCVVLNSIK